MYRAFNTSRLNSVFTEYTVFHQYSLSDTDILCLFSQRIEHLWHDLTYFFMMLVCEMLYISLQCIIVWVYNIWWGHQSQSGSYLSNSTMLSMFQCACWSVCLSAWSTTGTVTVIASYQHQNIHKLRHNGHNTAWILKCVWGGGGCTSVSIQAHLWHILWPWSLCRAWRCSLRFVYGSRLVYYEARANPEEMWAQDVLSLVRACFN